MKLAKIALIKNLTPDDDLAEEILDHQGIFYDSVAPGYLPATNYDIAILLTEHQKWINRAKSVLRKEGIILKLDKVMDINIIRTSLSGQLEARDRFELRVNREEQKLVDQLKVAACEMGSILLRKAFWPKGAKACIVITHDVDWLTYTPYHKVVFDRNKHKYFSLVYKHLIKHKDFGWNFDTMAKAYDLYGIPSTFFLRPTYDNSQHMLDKVIKLFDDSHFEFGLHSTGSAYRRKETMATQLKEFKHNIGRLPSGIRTHILKFNVPETWELENELGMQYDASFYYNEYFGFRCEICYPFHPLVPNRLPIVELPTSFMDWTALHRKYKGESIKRVLEKIMTSVERYNGLLVVNFHNSYLNKEAFSDIWDTFEWVIQRAKHSGYWFATAEQCVNWWKRRTAADKSILDQVRNVTSRDPEISLIIENC
ncbi:MAG: hypothetical protein QXX17_00505 [Conexivisphaerales archaeon]